MVVANSGKVRQFVLLTIKKELNILTSHFGRLDLCVSNLSENTQRYVCMCSRVLLELKHVIYVHWYTEIYLLIWN